MPQRKHYPALDGLRGIGFLIVFVAHLGQAYKSFYIAGKVGVGLFFVLSALFLSQYFFLHLSEMTHVRDWARYFWKRILRLYPMYSVILMVEFFVGRYSLSMVGSHLFLLDARQHYWTIPVEFQFYTLMPILAYILVKFLKSNARNGIFFLVTLIIGLGVFYQYIASPFANNLASQTSIVFYLPSFLIGIMLAILLCVYEEKKWGISPMIIRTIALASFLVICLLTPYSFNLFWEAGTSKMLFWLFTGYSLLWSTIIFSLLTTHYPILTTLLSHPWLRFLGDISYSAYLMHILVIAGVRHFLPSEIHTGYLISFLLTLILSSATYLLIEKPAMRFGIMKS